MSKKPSFKRHACGCRMREWIHKNGAIIRERDFCRKHGTALTKTDLAEGKWDEQLP